MRGNMILSVGSPGGPAPDDPNFCCGYPLPGYGGTPARPPLGGTTGVLSKTKFGRSGFGPPRDPTDRYEISPLMGFSRDNCELK